MLVVLLRQFQKQKKKKTVYGFRASLPARSSGANSRQLLIHDTVDLTSWQDEIKAR
jgi:hypothetical protein